MDAYDHVILGCGVAGLCAAQILSSSGSGSILVLDEYSEPGGNQISMDVNGYTFDIGAFYYWPTMPLFELFPEMRAICPQVNIHIERIQPSGRVGPYPFSLRDEVFARGPYYLLRALSSLALSRLRSRTFITAEDFAVHHMGARLYYDLGMANYIERFFGLPATEIESQFATSRMQAIVRAGSMRYWLSAACKIVRHAVLPARNQPAEVLIVRPERGLAFMYGTAVAELRKKNIDFRLGTHVKVIKKEETHFGIHADDYTIQAKSIVNTIPIKQACALLGIEAATELECVDLLTLFVSFEGIRGFDGCILYNWGPAGRWKRLTVHSMYYGERHGRQYASVEVPLFRAPLISAEELFEDFASSARAYDIFRGAMYYEGHSYVKNAYPAYTLGASAEAAKAVAAINRLGVQSVGRQGRFDYLPTGAAVANQVERILRV